MAAAKGKIHAFVGVQGSGHDDYALRHHPELRTVDTVEDLQDIPEPQALVCEPLPGLYERLWRHRDRVDTVHTFPQSREDMVHGLLRSCAHPTTCLRVVTREVLRVVDRYDELCYQMQLLRTGFKVVEHTLFTA